MRPRRHIVVLLLLFLAGATSPAISAGSHESIASASEGGRPDLPLHLGDALRLAMRNNWSLRSSQSAVAAAQGALRTAGSRPNPFLSMFTSRIHVDGLGDGTSQGNDFWSRSYDTIVQGGQLVEIGGKRGDRQRSAAAALEAARARLADSRRTIRADVVRAYVATALAQESARISRQSAGYLRDEARIAEVRWQAGDISRSDLDQIEIAAARLELDAETAEADARSQSIGLEMLIGVPDPSSDVTIADSLEWLASTESPKTRPAEGPRADLAAAQADLRRAENDLKLQRAQRVPDPTLVLQFEHVPPDRPNTVGGGLSLPLPLWNWNAGAITAAKAERDAADQDVKRVQAQVASDIAAARTSYDAAAARWRRYRDDLEPRSEDVRRTVSLSYEKGGSSLLDLLQAQRNSNDVRLATAQAAGDAAIAAAVMEAATETISVETIRP